MSKFAGSTTVRVLGVVLPHRPQQAKRPISPPSQRPDAAHAPEELWQLVEASAQDAPLSPQDKLDLEYAMGLLTASKPECYDYLWKHFVFGADLRRDCRGVKLNYDAVRMKIGRCLADAQSLMA